MTAPAQQQMPDISYKLAPDTGEITRTDKDSTSVIAVLDAKSGHVEFASHEFLKFRSPLLRFLNEEGVTYKTIGVKGGGRDKPDEDEPPCPKTTIEAGDKTPAVVEWFKKYRPKEYAVRYGIRGPGEVQVFAGFDTNPKTGEKTARYETKQAIIADRKTHLTEKPEANDGQPVQ